MSNIKVTNINSLDADSGRAKAWANLNGTGTIAIRDSLGVASLTDRGIGQYSLNLSTATSNTNGIVVTNVVNNTLSNSSNNGGNSYLFSTTVAYVNAFATSNGALVDQNEIASVILGDLA